ncbi:aminotransferase class I/II-fold pyridoxal phosphate-dependent enzyme [Sporosarcina luteola]|uniref:trans-sulfuration enzyme family protein n=1 Tax=Sporosarcina luteola TaxID=582850 RepID=UPI00203D7D2C|nr:aminotransferase class I/II-fold pyridoxal phosphate-dependent enzyme [Sporosarcina luteola]MCM3636576.1 aminotransferase class I/II-fold pyridoxal phosphate-dependent enzyme [Sporosarcina luteola]
MTSKSFETEVIHAMSKPDSRTRAVSPSIVPAVAYAFSDVESAIETVMGNNDDVYYGRYGNPTIKLLEEKIAFLEGGEAALAVSSGMAAISNALLCYLTSGDHVLVTKDIYGGTHHFLTVLAPRFGIEFDFVDCTDLEVVSAAIKENTKVLYIETPSNPSLTILDIKALSELAHAHGLSVVIDNTFMTPLLQRPLELGADLVVHSATKYINGHGDVIAGLMIGNQDDITFIRKNLMGDLGQNLNAWDAYLILRGIKTMAIRMKKHNENAMAIANFLQQHPFIAKVNYPGLVSHPQYKLAQLQMKGMGGIVTFELKGDFETAKRFLNQLDLAMISFSLGDPETLVQHPASMTHASIPKEQREKFGISDGLIRLSAGLEDAKDIIDDLNNALSVVYAESLMELNYSK